MKVFEIFKKKVAQATTTTATTVVTAVDRVAVDDVIQGILDDGLEIPLAVISISDQDFFTVGCVSYSTRPTSCLDSLTVITLEDDNGALYHLNGWAFLQWTRPCKDGVWA